MGRHESGETAKQNDNYVAKHDKKDVGTAQVKAGRVSRLMIGQWLQKGK